MSRAMLLPAVFLATIFCANAMPTLYNETIICAGGHCDNSTAMKYERKMDVQPGYQWDDAGG